MIDWVWRHSRSGGTQRLVLLALADEANDQGDNAFPSVATIARKAQVGERQVQRALRALVTTGAIVEMEYGGPAKIRADRRPRTYRVVMDGVTSTPPRRGDTRGDTQGSRGDTGGIHGVTPMSPDPKEDPYNPKTPSGGAAASPASPEGCSYATDTTVELVAFWVSQCERFWSTPTATMRAGMGGKVKTLLGEQRSPRALRRTLGVMAKEHKSVGALDLVLLDIEQEIAEEDGRGA